MKLIKKDYPFTIFVEDKVGKTTGRMYQSISVLHNFIKDKNATDPKDKYDSSSLHFFDEKDLLKLAQLCTLAYNCIKEGRDSAKTEQKAVNEQYSNVPADSDVPF